MQRKPLTGSDGASVPESSQSINLGSKNAGDLVSDIKVRYSGTTMTVTGQAKKIEGWEEFSGDPEEKSGHFVPITLPAETIGQQLTLKGRKAGDKTITGPEDRILIQRLENLDAGNKLTIEKGGQLVLTVDFSGMTQEEKP